MRTGLESFLAQLRESGARPLPRYVLDALRGYLRCGVFAHGFSRWHCDRCDHDLLVAFSCKRRSICPSCGVRRMDELGAALVDRVLPDVPYRQWVLSLPWALRRLCARPADVLTAVARALWQSLRAELRRRCGRPDGEPGAITFVQRFGGSLNLNVHLHVVVADGVFVETEGGGVRLVPLAPPTAEDVERVVGGARRRILRWLERKGYLDDDDGAQGPCDDDAPDGLQACQRTALHYGQLVGADGGGADHDRAEARFEPKPAHRCHARTDDGFDLDAHVLVRQGDDLGRERLVRYCARPAVALERLERLPNGRFRYRTKYGRAGRTHRVMSATELIARLAALVPPPRYPLVRYHGVFAPAHTWRRRVVPRPPEPRRPSTHTPSEPHGHDRPRSVEPAPIPLSVPEAAPLDATALRSPFVLTHPHMRRLLDGLLVMTGPQADWATLLRRSHGIDVLACPQCHGRLRLLAVVRDRPQVRRFLAHLGRPAEPMPIARARDPTFDFVA